MEFLESGPSTAPRRGRALVVVALLAGMSGFTAYPLLNDGRPPTEEAGPEPARHRTVSAEPETFRTGRGDCEVTVHGRYPLHPDCFSSEAQLERWLGVPELRLRSRPGPSRRSCWGDIAWPARRPG